MELDVSPDILIQMPEESNYKLPSPEILNFYKDIESRIFWISQEINDDMLELVQYIIQWNREDRLKVPEDRKPIKLFFNSVGGSLDIAEILISVIKLSKTPIYGITLGLAGSAASLIYLSCHKRFALPNAYLVIHQGSATMGGNYDQMVAAMKDYEEQVERMTKFYIENTDYTEEEIRANIKSDWYVRGDELKQRGLITDWVHDIEELL